MTMNKNMNKYDKMKTAYKKGGLIADMLVSAGASCLAGSFLKVIEEVMEEQKISKKKLAKLVKVSPSYITRIFNDDKLLSFNLLAKIEIVLGIVFSKAVLKKTIAEEIFSQDEKINLKNIEPIKHHLHCKWLTPKETVVRENDLHYKNSYLKGTNNVMDCENNSAVV